MSGTGVSPANTYFRRWMNATHTADVTSVTTTMVQNRMFPNPTNPAHAQKTAAAVMAAKSSLSDMAADLS
jgi:hypothetical protein